MRQFVTLDVCSIVPPFTCISISIWWQDDYIDALSNRRPRTLRVNIELVLLPVAILMASSFRSLLLSGIVRPIAVNTTKSATVSVSLCSAWVTCSTATCMNRQTHRHASISSPPVRFSRCCVIIKAWVHSYVKIRRMHSITGYSFKIEYGCNIHILFSIAYYLKIQQ